MKCSRGHDLTDNLTLSGRCRTCHNASCRAYIARRREYESLRLPAEPLANLICSQLRPGYTLGDLAQHVAANLGANPDSIERSFARLRRPGATVTRTSADRLCIGLGSHPVLVYGRAWDAA